MTRSRGSTRRHARIRCAIYTRKSSDEGLEQEFNSLQAQREACEAFINSQRHEGWACLPKAYDDGRFSGATMIDRLTRSLADFAKIVEILDARGASFVSVTQQFKHDDLDGALDPQCSAVLRPVRA